MDRRTIPLRARDGSIRAHAIVDPDRFDDLNRYTWHLSTHGYVQRLSRLTEEGDPRKRIAMHRQVLELEAGDGRHVDHINRDRLDNRRANLRFATPAENRQNTSAREGASSAFRGVTWDETNGRWAARVMLGRQNHFVGRFRSELAAALEAEAFRKERMTFAEPDPELVARGLAGPFSGR
jgi:hypothetical protein